MVHCVLILRFRLRDDGVLFLTTDLASPIEHVLVFEFLVQMFEELLPFTALRFLAPV